jgi:hypothetical protein
MFDLARIMAPASASISPVMSFSCVVLPAPFQPTRPTRSPFFTSQLMSLSTSAPLKACARGALAWRRAWRGCGRPHAARRTRLRHVLEPDTGRDGRRALWPLATLFVLRLRWRNPPRSRVSSLVQTPGAPARPARAAAQCAAARGCRGVRRSAAAVAGWAAVWLGLLSHRRVSVSERVALSLLGRRTGGSGCCNHAARRAAGRARQRCRQARRQAHGAQPQAAWPECRRTRSGRRRQRAAGANRARRAAADSAGKRRHSARDAREQGNG